MLGFSTRTSGTVWLINSPTAPPRTYSDQYVTVQTDRYVTTGYRSALFSAHSPLPTFSRSTSTYLLRSVRDIQADRQTDITTGYRSPLFSAHSPLPTFSHSTSTYLLRSVRDCSCQKPTACISSCIMMPFLSQPGPTERS